jgi:hypothetical protein
MARWTETIDDQNHLSKVFREMPIGGIVSITLLDGTTVEDVLLRVNGGNNAGRNGWRYYAECEIMVKDRSRWVIDYLDIKSVVNAWNESKAAEYQRLGLISIVR